MRAACARLGAVCLYPLDNEVRGEGRGLASGIRQQNMAMIGRADAVVAEMTPFRGPGMDGGTAYEMGAGAALGLVVVGWTAEPMPYAVRVAMSSHCSRADDGTLRDADSLAVEDFGAPLADNLMMAADHPVFDSFTDAVAEAVRQVLERRARPV
jgi:nucleoside 2-deoxyribosyltransferase